MPVTVDGGLRFCGREVSRSELALIRELVRDFPRLNQTELARTICELLDWRRPNGGLKGRECFLFLDRLQQRGWLASLPQHRPARRAGPRVAACDASSDPQPAHTGSLSEYRPIQLQRIETAADRGLFQQYIQRYHYLGYRVPVGAQLRYFVRSSARSCLLACLLFTSAAWKMAPRDRYIGWTDGVRRARLPLLVNNSRFLILPWIRVPHLASHILSLAARQLPSDWLALYRVRPVLLETLVDAARYSGTCYRAANWIHVGITQGRGRMDRSGQALGRSPKQIFLYPLDRRWREQLCDGSAPDSPRGGDHESSRNFRSLVG
jgi:hypothetical protein